MRNPYCSLLHTIWQHGRPWRKAIIGYYCAYVLAQIALSLSPYAFGRTIDILQNFNSSRMFEIITWLGIGVGVLVLFWIFHGPARIVERKVALRIQQAFRLKIYQQLTKLPLNWHQNHHSGNIITRIDRAAYAIYNFAETQYIYVETIIKFIVSIGFLLWLSMPMGLITLFASAVVVGIVVVFDRKLICIYNAENEIDNHLGAILYDYISNMTTVLTLRLGELTHTNLKDNMLKIWPFFNKDALLNETKWCTVMILLASMQSLVLIGYIFHMLNASGVILIGTTAMFFRYQWDLSSVFQEISVHYSELVRMNTDINGMQQIWDDIAKFTATTKLDPKITKWNSINITDLAFYQTRKIDGKEIFNNINLSIKSGDKIALIGASGCGKTTLLNLLSGLYTPLHALLNIDGVIFDSLQHLYDFTTLIPQDPEIFENTVAFNITMDLPATQEELLYVTKLAGFLPIINTLSAGFATDIREKGLNFSVGQKQRLALARGLFAARFSSLILMDEPTSSIDLFTEKEILTGVINAFPDTAIIVSLHRLHLLAKFNTIIMLDNGNIVASGPTVELLHNPGPVHSLWSTYKHDILQQSEFVNN